MKSNLLQARGKIFMLMLSILMFVACEKENDIPPGLSVEISDIKTFPGDEIFLKGMVSAENGIKTIKLICAGIELEKIYDLKSQSPEVFRFNHSFIVPETMSEDLDDVLSIVVEDVDDNVTTKEVSVAFLPDTTDPWFVSLPPSPASVDFDVIEEKADYILNVEISDDRELAKLSVSIPEIGYEKEVALSSLSHKQTLSIQFLATGTYSGTIKVEDKVGNYTENNITLIVLPKEDEDPIDDYAQMYVVNAEEDPDAYVFGYYKYMERTGAYTYTTKFYAAKNDTKIAFVPTQSVAEDYFGVSPYVSTKLINKNGYAVPINIPDKGYYTIEVNIEQKTYSVTAYTPQTPEYTGVLNVTGEGFDFANWTMSADMTKVDPVNPYLYTVEVGVSYSAEFEVLFCFTNASWSPIWRPTGNDGAPTTIKQNTGWVADVGNGTFKDVFQGPGNYTITFDLETLWATVSSKH